MKKTLNLIGISLLCYSALGILLGILFSLIMWFGAIFENIYIRSFSKYPLLFMACVGIILGLWLIFCICLEAFIRSKSHTSTNKP